MANLVRDSDAQQVADLEALTPGHVQTLQPTALVNEVYLRLADLGHVHLRGTARTSSRCRGA